ncbi:hypothetical protein EX30DRAFT_168684 [Ascodesmis nigricans]|uniref:Uncharacterized protein n=1 Tax=Ascodesmis nigricans TaxID=341454 RepID=A0A4S2MRV9_9PEZI|nr:hypothetical protein EX30DRAFT_168684 [Ascodesmis nigricans]
MRGILQSSNAARRGHDLASKRMSPARTSLLSPALRTAPRPLLKNSSSPKTPLFHPSALATSQISSSRFPHPRCNRFSLNPPRLVPLVPLPCLLHPTATPPYRASGLPSLQCLHLIARAPSSTFPRRSYRTHCLSTTAFHPIVLLRLYVHQPSTIRRDLPTFLQQPHNRSTS